MSAAADGAAAVAAPDRAGVPPALLVLGHGSRDPAAGAELDRLVALVTGLLPGTRVGAGCLELAEPFVDDAVDALVAAGAHDIVAVPVVLFGAGHLKDDGPAVLGRARRRHPGVRFRLARDFGIHPAVLAVAEDRARAALRSPGAAASARSPRPVADVVVDPAPSTGVVVDPAGSTGVEVDPAGSACVVVDPAGSATMEVDPVESAPVVLDLAGSACVVVDPAGSAAVEVDPVESAPVVLDLAGSAAVEVDPAGSAGVAVDPAGSARVDADPVDGAGVVVDPAGSAAVVVDPAGSAAVVVDPADGAAVVVDPAARAGVDSDPADGAAVVVDRADGAAEEVDPVGSAAVVSDPAASAGVVVGPAGSAGVPTRSGSRRPGPEAEEETAVVLVGRGSTDPDACAEMVKLARLLEDGRGLGSVEAAFAAMSRPDVEAALERCRRLGARRIAVVPLFLFAGVLVERVAERAAAWAAGHPDVEVVVGDHLGPDARLAALVVERHREAISGDVRMNCDVCVYRVRLPGFEDKVGTPLSLSPADRPARGWRARRAANQDAERAAARRERPRRGLGRRKAAPAGPEREGPAVRVSGLAHTFPDGTQALAGVDLVVEQGQRVAVLGPNGSGKTTLALHLIGALDCQAGTVAVTGLEVGAATLAEVRRRVGFVFQDPDDQLLLPTVADDVAFGPRNLGLAAEEVAARLAAALDVVGLTDLADRAPQHLSLGERRRAALAGVLAMQPEVLVLDEPSANLDPAARRDLVEIVGGLDVTTLVITHDLSLALELCPRSVVLDHGVVAADGPTRALLSNPGLLQAHRLDLPFGMVVPLPP